MSFYGKFSRDMPAGLETLQTVVLASKILLRLNRSGDWAGAVPATAGVKGGQLVTWDIQNLFRNHAKGIVRSLRRRGLSEETAADLTQDTFVRVIAAQPGKSDGNHNPKAYLYQAARNLGVNHQRREALVEMVHLESDEASNLADPAPSPERIVYSRQCLAQTYEALGELPERTRLAFEMHRLGERTIAEVAEELGVSTTRAWSLIREAYRHLIGRVDAT